MIGNLLKRLRFTNTSTKDRRGRAARLLAFLEENGTLILDKAGLATIGMNRKQAFQTVYDLVLGEKIQMRAEADGKVVAMSNAAFVALMEERAKETWRLEAGLVLGENALHSKAVKVEIDEDNPDILSGERQTFPDRRREPWITVENASLDGE